MEIISFAINLEHIGDIIDKNLSELATKKIKRRFQFSAEGAEELSAFHKRTMDSLRIAFGVFMSGDVNEARKLLAEKAVLRNAELAATERHLDRLREGRPETIETTSLHLDVLRDLRRIHSHICSVAYPVLDTAGELAAYRSAESLVPTRPPRPRGAHPPSQRPPPAPARLPSLPAFFGLYNSGPPAAGRWFSGARSGPRQHSRHPPPPLEKNQNAIGITLCPARSLEIHCTRKRAVNSNCAHSPKASQKSNLATKTS